MLAGTTEKNLNKKNKQTDSLVLTRNSPICSDRVWPHTLKKQKVKPALTVYCMYVLPTGIYSPAARTAQTLMFACICSLTKPGDTARGHTSRRRQSILSSMTSKTCFSDHLNFNQLLYIKAQRLRLHLAFFSFFHHRFEFDVSLEEAQTRKLDVAVKNNKMFHTRERKDIGIVRIAACDAPCLFYIANILTTVVVTQCNSLITDWIFKFCFFFPQVMLDLSQMNLAIGITEWYGARFSSSVCCKCLCLEHKVEFGVLYQSFSMLNCSTNTPFHNYILAVIALFREVL